MLFKIALKFFPDHEKLTKLSNSHRSPCFLRLIEYLYHFYSTEEKKQKTSNSLEVDVAIFSVKSQFSYTSSTWKNLSGKRKEQRKINDVWQVKCKVGLKLRDIFKYQIVETFVFDTIDLFSINEKVQRQSNKHEVSASIDIFAFEAEFTIFSAYIGDLTM